MSGTKPAAKPAGKSSSKGAQPSALARLARWALGPGRSLVILALLAGAATVGIVQAWPRIVELAHGDRELWLVPDGIDITPPPAWIKSDIRAEVVRDASLNGAVSLLDANLVERVRSAFSLHPWIEQVTRVSKSHPARVKVELKYRRPVAMIEVPGGLYPVDGAAVLLPSGDFSSQEAARYPRVSGITTVAVGPVGTPWGDPRVEGAARIAAALIDDWALLGLHQIVPSARPEQGATSPGYTYELFTQRETRVLWGTPPAGATNDPATVDKLARLKKIAIAQGSLDGPAGPQDIDVRNPGEAVVSPRTADRRGAPLE